MADDESGLSMAIPSIFAAVIFVTGLGGVNPDPGGLLPMAQDVITGSSAIAVFLAVKFLQRKFSFDIRPQVTWLFAACSAVISPLLIDRLLRGTFSIFLVSQIPVGIVSFGTSLFIIGIIWTGWKGSKSLKTQLTSQKLALARRKELLLLEIEIIKNTVLNEVRDQLSLGLSQVNKSISGVKELNRQEVSSLLIALLDNLVRPLSRRLASSDVNFNLIQNQVVSLILDRNLPNLSLRLTSMPLAIVSFCLYGLGPATVYFGEIGLELWLISLALTVTVQLVMGATLANKRQGVREFWMIASISALPSLVFLIPALQNPKDLPLSLSMIIGLFLLEFFIPGFLLITAQRIFTLRELSNTNASMQQLVDRLRQEEWFERERLARILHGSIQAQILVIALKVKSDQGLEFDADSIGSEIAPIAGKLDEELSKPTKSFRQQFDSIVETWKGACEVELVQGKEFYEDGFNDEVATACVIEIIREAVANASKHSGAKECQVSLKLDSVGNLKLSITNPGKLNPEGSNSIGFGTQLLDDLSPSWSLSQIDGSIVLEATIQLR